MSDDKTRKTCVSCGTGKSSGITDKLKFTNKKGGTVFIHYKTEGNNANLCRKCWQKNIRQFHDKIEKSVNASG